MPNEFYTSWREEAHWSSFHNAVVRLQLQLMHEVSSFPRDDEDRGAPQLDEVEIVFSRDESKELNGQQTCTIQQRNLDDSTTPGKIHCDKSTPQIQSRMSWDGDKSKNNLQSKGNFQSQNSSGKEPELDSSTHFDFYDANSTFHYVDVEVFEGGKETSTTNERFSLGDLVSPLNAPSSSLTHDMLDADALVSAEQQLVELKLRLAMTESERDELEFELMQTRGADDD